MSRPACGEMVVVCVWVYGTVVCEVRLCSMCCGAVTGGGVVVPRACRGHVVGEGAGLGPSVEVRVVLQRFVLCVSAYSVSAVSMLVLCG